MMFDAMPMFNQFQNQMQPPPNQFIIRQVGSENEARNSMISPLYIHIFINYNNGDMYVKRMGNTGLSEFTTYKPMSENKQNDPFEIINKRLSNIESKLGGMNESISISNAGNAESNDSANAKAEPPIVPEGSGNDARKK